MSQDLAFTVMLDTDYDSAIEQVTAALKEQGFGVLTTIDVKATMKQKLDADFRPYTILGACNPPLAHRALSAEAIVGVMLPCNVVVEDTGDGIRVMIANPDAIMKAGTLGENDTMCSVASDARVKLEAVAAALGS